MSDMVMLDSDTDDLAQLLGVVGEVLGPAAVWAKENDIPFEMYLKRPRDGFTMKMTLEVVDAEDIPD